MRQYPRFKAYFYNGFGKPELIATSVTGLLRDVTISDNYLGDCTKDMREELRMCKDKNEDFDTLKEYMTSYNIYINPTYESLVEVSKTWFGDNTPHHHFEDFE